MPREVRDEIIYQVINFNGCAVESMEMDSFIPLFMIDVITYPC